MIDIVFYKDCSCELLYATCHNKIKRYEAERQVDMFFSSHRLKTCLSMTRLKIYGILQIKFCVIILSTESFLPICRFEELLKYQKPNKYIPKGKLLVFNIFLRRIFL